MKKYILFDHDGVLVDTEQWYYKVGERALAEIGLVLEPDQYLMDMSQGAGTWAQARAAEVGHDVDMPTAAAHLRAAGHVGDRHESRQEHRTRA